MSAPVTVSVTRHVDPSRSHEMLAWVQAGTSLAEKFDGFLGSGWVRPSEDSSDWHMLYRFADAHSLAAWEASRQRAWSMSATPSAPPRWKQMVVIFMGFFPLSLAINYVVSHTPLADWPLPPRVFTTIAVMTPAMTYALLPWITRRMAWWLHRWLLPRCRTPARAASH